MFFLSLLYGRLLGWIYLPGKMNKPDSNLTTPFFEIPTAPHSDRVQARCLTILFPASEIENPELFYRIFGNCPIFQLNVLLLRLFNQFEEEAQLKRKMTAMAAMIAYGEFDAVLASRILGVGALKGGMPLYKYLANRFLTLVENILLGQKFSEYHTGYRAFSREVLEALPLGANSNDFVFDNQMIAQMIWFDFRVGEISCPTKYFPEASSINFRRSVIYGLGVLGTALLFRLNKWGLAESPRYRRYHDGEIVSHR